MRISGFAFLFSIGVLFTVVTGYSQETSTPGSVYDVKAYGAVGDATTDDTAAIQRALDDAGAARGGIVWLPSGNYMVRGHLNIPSHVTLEGIWTAPPAWSAMAGSTLLAVEGRGDENGTPFITLQPAATLKGVTIYYPEQKSDDIQPYPWCIAGIRDNPSIIDVMLINPYLGVDFGNTRHEAGGVGRFLIRNLYGQPLRKGIFIDGCLDVGRIENVHFWPFWQGAGYTREHGEAFIFGRTDWQYVLNTFCWGYKIGYKFVNVGQGPCNGNFVGIGADFAEYAVYAESASDLGVLITNGEFVSFGGKDSVEVVTTPDFIGTLQFQNSAFWGPAKMIARLDGKGTVTFDNCNFRHWGYIDTPQFAIDCLGGNLIINSSHFFQSCPKVWLREGVRKAVITGNIGSGIEGILNESNGSVVIDSNAFDGIPDEGKNTVVVDNSMPWGASRTGAFECSEGWGKEDRNDSYMGEAYYAAEGDGSKTARWTPNLETSGKYEVFVWLPAKQVFLFGGQKPATNVPYTIARGKQSTTATVDYSRDSVGWHSLGIYKFGRANENQYIEITNNADGFVAADAVKFVRR